MFHAGLIASLFRMMKLHTATHVLLLGLCYIEGAAVLLVVCCGCWIVCWYYGSTVQSNVLSYNECSQ